LSCNYYTLFIVRCPFDYGYYSGGYTVSPAFGHHEETVMIEEQELFRNPDNPAEGVYYREHYQRRCKDCGEVYNDWWETN